MMRNVPRNNVCETPPRYRVPASHAASLPRFARQLSKRRHRIPPNVAKLPHMAGPRILIRSRRIHAYVLTETRQGFVKIAPKPQSAKCEPSLRVIQMAQYLPEAPLFRRVPAQRFFFGDSCEDPA